MEKKKSTVSTVLLLIAVFVIGALVGYVYIQKTESDKQIAELENNASKLQETINDLQGKIDTISNTINSNKDEEDKEDKEDITDITAKCKTAFEEYYDLQVEFYSGGSLYVLKKLDLVSTIPAPEQYETTTHGADDFYKTDIKYSDFKNAMLKYMTSDILEKEFEKYHAKNVDGYLHITAMGGTATNIDIDKFELSSNDKGSYTFNITAERSADDNPSKDTVNMKATFEKQNGNYVVSNVEEL